MGIRNKQISRPQWYVKSNDAGFDEVEVATIQSPG
jgi:hypothetical protein